jgi:hypothetical protein
LKQEQKLYGSVLNPVPPTWQWRTPQSVHLTSSMLIGKHCQPNFLFSMTQTMIKNKNIVQHYSSELKTLQVQNNIVVTSQIFNLRFIVVQHCRCRTEIITTLQVQNRHKISTLQHCRCRTENIVVTSQI